ncbi:MAG TPA: DNA polymerase IV, partial [bacterium]|nr:DNA polymerase IV [bacterium]
MSRTILHIDMDAFFAAVEQNDHPEWRGKPVVVGSDPQGGRGRGVVSTCSYEARRFGIHSAMPISQAWKLNPEAIYVRPRGRRYAG